MTGHGHDLAPDPAARWAARISLLLELLIISLAAYVAWTGSTRALGSLILVVWVSLSLRMARPHSPRARTSEDS